MKRTIYLLLSNMIVVIACAHPSSIESQRSLSNAQSSPEQVAQTGFPNFENFEFPHYCFDPGGEPFSLVEGHHVDQIGGGEMTLSRVKYADATGDGADEALVVLAISTGGTSHPYCVYIFAERRDDPDKPELLWSFRTGDRADGGLRDVYGDDGRLVIETYLPDERNGDCCPKYFKRDIYAFDSGKFVFGNSSTHLNPDSTALLAQYIGPDGAVKIGYADNFTSGTNKRYCHSGGNGSIQIRRGYHASRTWMHASGHRRAGTLYHRCRLHELH